MAVHFRPGIKDQFKFKVRGCVCVCVCAYVPLRIDEQLMADTGPRPSLAAAEGARRMPSNGGSLVPFLCGLPV
jgi:hypothetical protein